MTAMRAPQQNISGLYCNAVGCRSTFAAELEASVLQLRDRAHLDGWSSPLRSVRARSAMHTLDYCSSCTYDQRCRPGCRRCPGGEVHDFFGHNRAGHAAARLIFRCGWLTLEQARSRASRSALQEQGVGPIRADMIVRELLQQR